MNRQDWKIDTSCKKCTNSMVPPTFNWQNPCLSHHRAGPLCSSCHVTSRLGHNNSLLSGVTETKILVKLKKVQNAAAKLILRGKKRDHVTPLLKDLHWLPIPQRVIFKTGFLVYKTLHGDGPAYLHELLKPYTCGRGGMRSADDTTRLQVFLYSPDPSHSVCDVWGSGVQRIWTKGVEQPTAACPKLYFSLFF